MSYHRNRKYAIRDGRNTAMHSKAKSGRMDLSTSKKRKLEALIEIENCTHENVQLVETIWEPNAPKIR